MYQVYGKHIEKLQQQPRNFFYQDLFDTRNNYLIKQLRHNLSMIRNYTKAGLLMLVMYQKQIKNNQSFIKPENICNQPNQDFFIVEKLVGDLRIRNKEILSNHIVVVL
jgi:hypothetical protein